MADYELYGEYNKGEDEEDEGPKRNPVVVWIIRILKWIGICILAGTCIFFAIRITLTNIYPKDMKRVYFTSSLSDYAKDYTLSFEKQKIRVPFEGDILVTDGNETLASSSQNGFFYACNLLVEKQAGALQVTIRLNQNIYVDLESKYSLSELHLDESHFSFKLVASDGTEYVPTCSIPNHMAYYDYLKLCFDGVSFDNISWMRVEITPNGMTGEVLASYVGQAICVYENTDTYSSFKPYRLTRQEKSQ